MSTAMSTAGLSAYELDRLATIRANNQYLASLNLGPSPLLKDATNKAPRPTKKKSLRKPKRKPKPKPHQTAARGRDARPALECQLPP